MDEFIKIAQENYIRAEAERRKTVSHLDRVIESATKVLEKLALVSCAVLLMIDAVMFTTIIIHQMTH